MLHEPKHNPLGRFDGLGSAYAKHRPEYPARAIEWVAERLPPAGIVADVGAGTGIFSRQIAERGFRVIGIEPNESMRQQSERNADARIDLRGGAAESTGLDSNSVDGVVAAQAFHWFDRAAALLEFQRILRPNGWVSLLWNTADEADGCTCAFWRILQAATPEPEVVREPHCLLGRILLDHPLYANATFRETPNEQMLDEEGLLGRGLSASFAPKECGAAERFAEQLRGLFRERAVKGYVRLRYRTSLYQARRGDQLAACRAAHRLLC